MLEVIYGIVFIMSCLFFLIAIYEESLIFSFISLVFWIYLFVQSLWIEVPYEFGVYSGGTWTIEEGSHVYNEWGLSVLCLIFIFISIIFSVVYFMDWRNSRTLAPVQDY